MNAPTENTASLRSYTQKQLYELVADASSYPRFLPFCTSARVLKKQPPNPPSDNDGRLHMDVELTVGFMSFSETYVSKVTCRPYESVEVRRHAYSRSFAGSSLTSLVPVGRRGVLHTLVQVIEHSMAVPTRLRAISPSDGCTTFSR